MQAVASEGEIDIDGMALECRLFVRPIMTAPAARNRSTTTASSTAAGASVSTVDPAVVGSPRMSKKSLTEIGMPPSKPVQIPARRLQSMASASARAQGSLGLIRRSAGLQARLFFENRDAALVLVGDALNEIVQRGQRRELAIDFVQQFPLLLEQLPVLPEPLSVSDLHFRDAFDLCVVMLVENANLRDLPTNCGDLSTNHAQIVAHRVEPLFNGWHWSVAIAHR